MLPNTYLLCAPNDEDPLGVGMSSKRLISGLRNCNANIIAPTPDMFDCWYPGREFKMTCAWLGRPSAPGSLKLFAFKMGVLPEHTQLEPGGKIINLGWRALLSKAVASGAVTRRAVEREFKVTLEREGKDKLCPPCMKMGKQVKATSAGNVCDFHHFLNKKVRLRQSMTSDLRYLIRRYG